MKTYISPLSISFFMTGILVTNCGEQSNQDAKNVKEDVKKLNKD